MAHRRRGIGVGSRRTGGGGGRSNNHGNKSSTGGNNNSAYAKKAGELKSVSLAAAVETVKRLEVKLAEFAKRHRDEIRNDPAFRARFLAMCGPLGVDPLSSDKGFWGNLGLGGLGGFYYELAVKVAEVCLSTRSRNGGIMSVAEVRSVLRGRGTKFAFTSDAGAASYVDAEDILTAVRKLSVLGSGFRTVTVGTVVMIVSVPTELDNDHTEVLRIAQAHPGVGITDRDVTDDTGWTADRTHRALDLLLGKGMAWLDVYGGNKTYWFPSIWKEGLEDDTQENAE